MNVAFDVVGTKWKPTILWCLSQGARRFAALRREVGAISEKVLAQQLRELERDGIVTRTVHEGFPLRVEYTLTERGTRLDAALTAVAEWGEQNVDHVVAARASAHA
ncbi:transcriptional regulator [Rhodococcus rhodnii]|uniref:Transcriptional regulator n=1 Tax=Rhodococcus rhodnii TaxID=38312 RepID=A0A6P2CNC5_9NOCA|nr:transcriptional regulator [Rhodococcus rhodnii]